MVIASDIGNDDNIDYNGDHNSDQLQSLVTGSILRKEVYSPYHFFSFYSFVLLLNESRRLHSFIQLERVKNDLILYVFYVCLSFYLLAKELPMIYFISSSLLFLSFHFLPKNEPVVCLFTCKIVYLHLFDLDYLFIGIYQDKCE